MLLLISKMAKIAYPAPGEISNVVGEERCLYRTNAKIEPNVIKPICTQA